MTVIFALEDKQDNTHGREEEKTREGGTGAVAHQGDALRIAAKLTDVLLVKKMIGVTMMLNQCDASEF